MSFFTILVMFFIFYYIFKSTNISSPYTLLKKVFITKRFANVANVAAFNDFYIIRADADGENYIFAVKKHYAQFTNAEISKFYEYASKAHIHYTILVTYSSITPSSPIYRKIKEYDIEVWDYKKLIALSSTTTQNSTNKSNGAISNTYSILKTSDTSNDKCKIDKNSFDPIQDGNLSEGLFSKIFDKPTRL